MGMKINIYKKLVYLMLIVMVSGCSSFDVDTDKDELLEYEKTLEAEKRNTLYLKITS